MGNPRKNLKNLIVPSLVIAAQRSNRALHGIAERISQRADVGPNTQAPEETLMVQNLGALGLDQRGVGGHPAAGMAPKPPGCAD